MQKLHPRSIWLFFISFTVRWFFFLFFIAIWLLAFSLNENISSILELLKWLAIIIPILLIIFYVWARLSYRFYRYELREDCFRKEHGVVWKKYVSIPYNRIQNVDIYRGVWARILGLSDLHIQTAGMSYARRRGAIAEGRLPGLSQENAERIRDELIQRARRSKDQGL